MDPVGLSSGLTTRGCDRRTLFAAGNSPTVITSGYYFWPFWKRLFTSAQFTTFHHSFR
jgi:hypothetical protein